ncbi:MAG: histidinol-phosphatase [Marinilabiliaceae bacterium]|nr:histidinol-phosphatase [Marinilabiliaceae bacterium]
MSWSNYHCHSCYCDGKGELIDYIAKAKELKVKVLGISSHAPVPFAAWWTMSENNLPQYLKQINTLKQKHNNKDFTLLSSLEVDFIPNVIGPKSPSIISANLDYIVGSIHYVDSFETGEHWTIDSDDKEFEKGINEIFYGDVYKAISLYFELQMQMLDSEPPNIIGHLDKIRIHNKHKPFFDENSKKFVAKVYDLMKFASEKGVIVEINTKYFSDLGLLFPDKEHFKWMKQNKIPITLSSDAHQPNQIICGFDDVAQLLIDVGYKELWIWNGKEFAPNGF